MALARMRSSWPGSELTRVRAASWAGALGLAALLLAFAAQPVSPGAVPTSGEAAAVEAVMADPIAPPAKPRAPAAARVARAGSPRTGEALAVRLWSYDADGRIVFASAEQYRRCLAARTQRRDEADCPSADERAGLALVESSENGFPPPPL